ncbi:hypothetical protein [Desulfocurvibacter africanus]|uniref:Uncharacterized protein n=1 Tax=Desulfocurvibacter africanus subsp. africanus str. Walvis Bay TaxID=690850 RepID=F3YXE4_DESAF|nr:hypothetical protein [Desulfocurvibacter africanus]EGJ51721.1 hypothetical protein Desaf_3435 [Desulfocurvibacter africanus subsp. africanus str. Walvis Bay]
MPEWALAGEVDPAELGSYKSTTIATVGPPAAQPSMGVAPVEAQQPGGEWEFAGVVGGTEDDAEAVRKAGNVFGTVQAVNQERSRFGLPSITEADLPDRSGLLGRVKDLGSGIYEAVVDRFPEDVARMWRGGDVYLNGDSWADRTIEENRRDRAMRLPSRQYASGDIAAKSLHDGPASMASSVILGLGGAALGTPGGPIGQAIGAAALTGPAYYRLAKDSFIEQVREHVQSLNINLSPQQWEQIKADIDDKATKYGLWEAGPELLSQAFTAGLLKGAAGPVLSRVLGFKAMSNQLAKSAVARTMAKLGAEVAEEELTGGLTYYGQAGIERDAGLRQTEPTLGEFAREQAGPVAYGSLLQGRGMDLAHKVAGHRQRQTQPVQAQPTQVQTQPQVQLLPANPAPFATAGELGLLPEGQDFADTPTVPQLTFEQEIIQGRQRLRSNVEDILREGRESYQRNVR